MSRILLLLLAINFALAPGCDDPNDPDKVASRFVDAYYVEYDFERALGLAEGSAAHRLAQEQRLAEEARRKVTVAASRSRTYYGKPERRSVQANLVHYTFPLEIRMGETDLEKTAVVMLGRRGNAWKVIRFRELAEGDLREAAPLEDDLPPDAAGAPWGGVVRSSTEGESGTLAP